MTKGFTIFVFLLAGAFCFAQTTLIPVGHSHNDYRHKKPLEEALKNGFLSIEVDVFLKKGQLVVSHVPLFLGCKKTLEELYLLPLAEEILQNGGTVYKNDSSSLVLMLDLKSDASEVFPVLDSILRSFPGMFSSFHHGRQNWGPITIMNSGKKAREELAVSPLRFMVIDGNLRSKDLGADSGLFTRVSADYSKLFSWKGDGKMPVKEHNKLSEYVRNAHSNGKKLRFWKTNDNPVVWKVLLDAGVDWINVDNLAKFRIFYLDYIAMKE